MAAQRDRRLSGQIQSKDGTFQAPSGTCLTPARPQQSDRRKAQVGMEAAWKSMEKKEKIPWIKKAAEDQKRYEVCCERPAVNAPPVCVVIPAVSHRGSCWR